MTKLDKSLLFRSIVMGFIVGLALYAIVAPNTIHADLKNTSNETSDTLVYNNHLTICMLDRSSYHVVKTIKGKLTAYTNTKDQTDGSPNYTASGFDLTTIKPGEGVVANNFLRLGTKVRIPDLFPGTIFTVEDTGSPTHFDSINRFDVYIPGGEQARAEAMRFGRRTATVEVVES